jgi:hypothetical protein
MEPVHNLKIDRKKAFIGRVLRFLLQANSQSFPLYYCKNNGIHGKERCSRFTDRTKNIE